MRAPRKPPEDKTAFAVPTLAEARALSAWNKGEATADQQRLAFNFVILKACGAGKDALAPGFPDVTAYLNGRLSVSLQIGWVLGQPANNFRKGEVDV